jgi:undecaprenyl-diphosphatase
MEESFMSIYLSVIILGLVQGLAEFLPISSSGHLVIFQSFLPGLDQISKDMTLDVLLHLGTLIAVFVVYRKTIWNMIIEFFRMIGQIFSGKFKFRKANKYQLMCIFVIVATLPLFLVVFVSDFIESKMRNLLVVGIMLFITAALLFIADRSVKGKKQMKDMTVLHALKLGLFQMVATIPGLSRSGSTISAAINMGFDRQTAVEFSFIMAIPAVIGANILSLKDVFEQGFNTALLGPYIVGIVIAAVTGIAAINLVKYISRKDKFGWFSIYCIIAGIVSIVLYFVL